MVDAAPAVILMIRADGRVVRTNTAARSFFGLSFDELVGADAEQLARPYLGEEDPLRLRHVQATGEPFEGELPSIHGEQWFRLAVYPVAGPNGDWQRAVCHFEDVTERKRDEEHLQHSLQRMRELAAHLQRVREEERRRIAQEMHDELGHQLTALKLDLAWLSHEPIDGESGVKERLADMTRLLDRTMRTLRTLTSELHPEVLDHFGLAAAVEWQVEEFQDHADFRTELDVQAEELSLPDESATAVYRIFQEALTNVARHARAKNVKVSLKREGCSLRLRIEDDGRGFDPDAVEEKRSFGILGMKERALVLGGSFSIESAPQRGTRISVCIPLAARSG